MIDIAVSLTLVVVAVIVSRYLRLRLERELSIATVRALAQLLVVAAIVNLVFSSLGLSSGFILVMLVVAAWTSSRRLKGVPNAIWLAAASIALSSGIALAVLFAGRVFELQPQFLIPIAGMLIGNTMNATSLAGSRLRDDVTAGVAEIEARLALGVGVSEAVATRLRKAVVTALVPTIDATKTVGIIHLPGAFVGMVLAGADPANAARVQLIVLFMLLGAVSLAGMITTLLVARSFVAPGERLVLSVSP